MTTAHLQAKLLASSSYKAFQAESVLRRLLQDHGWDAFQGTYYRDQNSGKLREIDVLGRATWNLWTHRQLHAVVEVVVEAKTMKGYHLLFAPFVMPPELAALDAVASPSHLMREWVGGDTGNRRYIESILRRCGVDESDVRQLSALVRANAYPDEALIKDLMIDPPPVSHYTGAFRETNVGSEKELEASVLWKATTSLMSAVQGLKRTRRRSRLSTAKILAGVAASEGRKDYSLVRNALSDAVAGYDQFHPVIVVDASLWHVAEDEIVEAPWCRMIMADSRGYPHFWVDIVHFEQFAAYCEDVLSGYPSAFECVGAERGPHEFLF